MKKKFNSSQEITEYFIKNGWTKDTSFSELTLEEAEKRGYYFAIRGLKKGHKFFIMNICENIYDEYGQLKLFGKL